MGKREDSKKESRQRLLAAAAASFAEKGYDGCSVTDIASRAGMAQGALYVHFKDKKSLLIEMLRMEHSQGAARAAEVLAGQPGLDGILSILSSCIRNVGWPVDHRLWTEMLAVAARDETVREAFRAGDAAMRAVLVTLLKAAAEAGEVDRGLDFESVSIWLYALVDGLIARTADDPDCDVERHVAVFETMARRALAPRREGVRDEATV